MKWIYTVAMSYGLYEAVVFASAAPILWFSGCGIVYLSIKDGKG